MGFISLKDWRARSAGLAQAASRAKALLRPALALSEADALSVNEIACTERGTVFAPGALPRIGIDLASRLSFAARNRISLTPRGGGASS